VERRKDTKKRPLWVYWAKSGGRTNSSGPEKERLTKRDWIYRGIVPVKQITIEEGLCKRGSIGLLEQMKNQLRFLKVAVPMQTDSHIKCEKCGRDFH